MTAENENTGSKIRLWVPIIISLLILLFGGGVFSRLWERVESQKSPTFEFIYEGVFQQEIVRYEVTQEQRYADGIFGEFEITVSANYRGDKFGGPVIISILPSSGSPFEVARWDDFRTSHRNARTFTLAPSELFKYSGLSGSYPAIPLSQNNLSKERVGRFDIEVSYEGQPLVKKAVTVVNTPWTHSVQLSDGSITKDMPITAYVTVKNLGSPSEFNIVGLLYESSEIFTPSLEIGKEGWWPGKSWKYTESKSNIQTDLLDTNQELTVELPFPDVSFNERHSYLVETYAVKKLPDLKFSDGGDWMSSKDSWRIRDQPQYSTLVVLAP